MPFNNNSLFNKTSQPGRLGHREISNVASIYHRYLLGLAPPRGQDMMNSSVNRPETDNIKKFDSRNFKMMLADTDIETQIEIEILEDVQIQNVNIWAEKIKELIKNNSYTKQGGIAIINSLISFEIKDMLNDHKDPNRLLEEIIELKYDSSYLEKLNSDLRNSKQIRYMKIKEYYIKTKSIIDEIGKCRKWTKQEKTVLLESRFIENLTVETRIKMSEMEKFTCEDIVKYISAVEATIKEDYEKMNRFKNFKNDSNNGKYLYNLGKNPKNFASKNKFNNQYCTFHKTKTHDTKDCIKLKQISKHSKNESNLVVKNFEEKSELLVIEAKINQIKCECLIDTGSNYSIISKKSQEELNLKPTKINSIRLQTASNNFIKAKEKINTQINFQGINNAFFNIEFLVVNELPVGMLLGNNFLKSNQAVICYNSDTLKLNGLCTSLKSYKKGKVIDQAFLNIKEKEILSELKDSCDQGLGEYIHDKHKIYLESEPLIKIRQYTVPFAIRETAKKHIKELIDKKIIQKSDSKYCSPAFIIPKRDNAPRLVVDYSNINKHTIKEVFPCPNLHECLTELSNNKIFSSIDLNMGYHQIIMDENSRKYTSFIFLSEQYEYLRMPFGLANAPRTFQRAMQNILGHLDFVKIYLDDVLIHSKEIEEHHNHIMEVVRKLKESGMSINLDKSKFYKFKIEYLGHFITPLGYRPNLDKINIYKKIPLPKTLKQLQKLIGIINWFRPFLSQISNKIIFLTDKLRIIDKNIKWEPDEIKKMQNIWEEIKNSPWLSYPNFSEKFFIEVDASERGIGGVLYQNHGILGFYSYKLNDTEIRYSIVEKESFAIYKMIIRFKSILFNGNIVVKTDNRNSLFNPKDSNSRINRWREQLSEYSIDYQFISGKNNIIADKLSREFNNHSNLINKSDMNDKIVEIHNKHGHPGSLRTFKTINLKYKINLPYHRVVSTLKSCLGCRKNIDDKSKFGKIAGILSSEYPLEVISSDIVGPFKNSIYNLNPHDSKFFLLTITDIFSRYSEVFYLKEINTKNIISKCFKIFFDNNGIPKQLITDNGRQYVSLEFRNFLENNKIKHITTSAYNPTSNGISERLNQTIIKNLKINKHKNIKEIIRLIMINLNETYNTSIEDFPINILNEYKTNKDKNSKTILKIKNINQLKRERNLENINSKRKENKFIKGNLVLVKNHIKGKLEDKYTGPFEISKTFKNKNIV
ncbi:Retrovirus-related Pol polyprotein from transposon 17.6 [Dictyocoela muelleri]|nr:Retrovirus-related Pol polyprotein from transposon 17.6 [Dictyocoela muelleri]